MKASLIVLALAVPAHAMALQANSLNGSRIEELTGLKGTMDEKENVFKVSYPRSDLVQSVKGVRLTPAMGLSAWAAFQPAKAGVVVMGDLVLTEEQVNPVMSVALDNGLEVTGLHNHFFWESPRVMFMHIGGKGGQEELASAVGAVFKKLKETQAEPTAQTPAEQPSIDPAHATLNTRPLEGILGYTGELKDGVFKVIIGRQAKMGGLEVGKTMGINTWAAFTGSDQNAVVVGDYAMLESELQPVLKSLRKAEIQILAIHNHMTMEEPRYVFLHYWGRGDAKALAKGLKSALETQSLVSAP